MSRVTQEQADKFLRDSAKTVKRTYRVNEEDYNLVASVFPEHGVLAYLPGLIFNRVAEKLRSEGISTVSDRETSKLFKTVDELIENVTIRKSTSSRGRSY